MISPLGRINGESGHLLFIQVQIRWWSNRLYYLGHRNWFVMKNQPIGVSETRTIHNCAHRDKRDTKARDRCENTCFFQDTPEDRERRAAQQLCAQTLRLCGRADSPFGCWTVIIKTTGRQLFFAASSHHLEHRWAGVCVLPGINCIQQGKLNPRLKRRLPVG